MVSNFFELIKKATGKTIKESIELVKELIYSYWCNDKEMLISYSDGTMYVRGNIIPTDDITINMDEIYIYDKNDFELHIKKEIKQIEFEEIDKLFFIKFDGKEEVTFGF